MKQQVVFISGGEVFESRESFKAWLASDDSDFMLPAPNEESVTFWSRNLPEDLGEQYEVLTISMPLKMHARYDEWKIWFEKHIQFMDEEVIFVGWSLGANFLAKYLSENGFKKDVKSLHLVAGCYGCGGGFELEDVTSIEKLTTSIFIYHSKDDTVVAYQDAITYSQKLPDSKLVSYSDKGHFLVEKISELLENIKNN